MMNGHRKSDSSIVPEKLPNKDPKGATEAMEGRGLTKGNLLEQNTLRTQGRGGVPSALERVREAVRKEKGERFTALFHHVYDVNRLREAYYGLKRQAVPGVDGETWQQYGEDLEGNLQDLSERLKRGAYRAKPVQRAYVPKDRWEGTTDRNSDVGRQDRTAGHGRGIERHLRKGLPRFLVWFSSRKESSIWLWMLCRWESCEGR